MEFAFLLNIIQILVIMDITIEYLKYLLSFVNRSMNINMDCYSQFIDYMNTLPYNPITMWEIFDFKVFFLQNCLPYPGYISSLPTVTPN